MTNEMFCITHCGAFPHVAQQLSRSAPLMADCVCTFCHRAIAQYSGAPYEWSNNITMPWNDWSDCEAILFLLVPCLFDREMIFSRNVRSGGQQWKTKEKKFTVPIHSAVGALQ